MPNKVILSGVSKRAGRERKERESEKERETGSLHSANPRLCLLPLPHPATDVQLPSAFGFSSPPPFRQDYGTHSRTKAA